MNVLSKDVLIQKLEDESVMVHFKSEQHYGLDDVATRMWSALTQTPEVEAAYQALLADYEVEPEKLRQDLQELIEKLVEHGILETSV